VTTKRAVEAPMDEQAKLRFMPPLHSARAIRNGRSCRRTDRRTRLCAETRLRFESGQYSQPLRP
jgi:hypothetical protein